MKQIAIFFITVILIICIIFGISLNYKIKYNASKKANLEFENYLYKDIYGTDVVTVINRAIDNNNKNEIEKNDKGIYINNNENSVNIEIKMIDNDTIYQMETIYNGGIENFVKYYSNIKFKCTDIKYHQKTQRVQYLLFEQISQ